MVRGSSCSSTCAGAAEALLSEEGRRDAVGDGGEGASQSMAEDIAEDESKRGRGTHPGNARSKSARG